VQLDARSRDGLFGHSSRHAFENGGLEELTAAMRIEVSTSRARDELARFLAAGGLAVDVQDATTLEVDSPHGGTPAELRRDLELRLATWRAMRPHGSTRLAD
jgi:hypothetical protein